MAAESVVVCCVNFIGAPVLLVVVFPGRFVPFFVVVEKKEKYIPWFV